jgi:alanyl-tRNA synthetase
MDSNALRERFLKFFEGHGHTRVASSSLVPGDDPTLLFTNAGMNQFKDVFLGREKRPYVRAVSSQKCVRAGGKHNDLENVGYTARHHTFFEMLGNFSFGDYFKKDAIELAWEFVTGKSGLGIDPKRLMVTVYHTDDEAYDLWAKIVPKDRIVRIGDKPGGGSDNFWQMGETGPCGPCSEIFYDHGSSVAGGPPGSADADGDRWVEIWNLVFMQFNRDASGTLEKLPKPSVDTGAGLERIAAVMQGVQSNYDTDQFKTLIASVRQIYGANAENHPNSQRVVADHIRATAFLIADGVMPSNEGRGYVLRRIMRRALRHGWKMGSVGDFFSKMVEPLVQAMGVAYPELKQKKSAIEAAIRQEEKQFAQTLDNGMMLLQAAMQTAKNKVIPGEAVFKLYDTYGFPVDLTADIARENGLSIDEAGYEKAMDAQRDRARAASSFKAGEGLKYEGRDTCFIGYEHLTVDRSEVLALYKANAQVKELKAGESGIVVLSDTPFYAEGGGQVGDRGQIISARPERSEAESKGPSTSALRAYAQGERDGMVFEVADTQKIGSAFGHHGAVKAGTLKVGDTVGARVTESVRRATMRNHSATHLMHRALRDVLGTHVTQKGSLVDHEHTRFDFSHPQPVTAGEIARVEDQVNRAILANVAATATPMKYDDAIKAGAMALFGEKYGDTVRVLQMGEHSTELCGGTHVARTGDIGMFKIVSEGGVAAGIRRVVAITGEGALAHLRETEKKLAEAAALVRGSADDLATKVQQLLDRNKALEKELAATKQKLASGGAQDLTSQVKDVKGVKVLSAAIDGMNAGDLRTLMDQLKNKLGSGIVVLGTSADGKAALIAGVTADLTAKVKAGELVSFVAQQVGGKGGGRPDMAQAGGTQPENLAAALASVYAWVEEKLSS